MYLIDYLVVVVAAAAVAALVVVVVLVAASVASVVNCRSGFGRVFVSDFVVARVEIGFAGRLSKRSIIIYNVNKCCALQFKSGKKM